MKPFQLLLTLLLFSYFLQSCVVHTKRPVNHHKTNVVYVKKVPKKHKIVVVKGKKYYYFNGKHHRKTNKGFLVIRIK